MSFRPATSLLFKPRSPPFAVYSKITRWSSNFLLWHSNLLLWRSNLLLLVLALGTLPLNTEITSDFLKFKFRELLSYLRSIFPMLILLVTDHMSFFAEGITGLPPCATLKDLLRGGCAPYAGWTAEYYAHSPVTALIWFRMIIAWNLSARVRAIDIILVGPSGTSFLTTL